jgi:hypothetical protein
VSSHRRTHHRKLTDAQIANIIFNETRSLSGTDIASARVNIAHTIINGLASPHRMPHMAPAHAHPAKEERGVLMDCQAAVRTARENIKNGQDPTNGATHFNFRNGPSQASFQEHAIETNVGPLNNSYPTDDLPATNIYANTYE